MRFQFLCCKILAASRYRVEISHVKWYSKNYISYEDSPGRGCCSKGCYETKNSKLWSWNHPFEHFTKAITSWLIFVEYLCLPLWYLHMFWPFVLIFSRSSLFSLFYRVYLSFTLQLSRWIVVHFHVNLFWHTQNIPLHFGTFTIYWHNKQGSFNKYKPDKVKGNYWTRDNLRFCLHHEKLSHVKFVCGIRFNFKRKVVSSANRLCPVFYCDILTAYVIRIASYSHRADDAYVNKGKSSIPMSEIH